MKIAIISVATAALVMAVRPSYSAPTAHAKLAVTEAWSRPTPNGLPTGVVYMTIANPTSRPDKLVAASTPVAAHMELHRSSMRGGIMSMDAVPGGLDIPAGAKVLVAPNGYHYMLTGLRQGLNAGAHFPVTLSFAHAGAVKVEVQVQAAPPAMAGMTMR